MSELATVHPLPAAQGSPDQLIALALEKGASVDALERLMALRERFMADEARRAYFEALARFQSECPPIPRARAVKYGNTSYNFAPLDVIAATVREPLQRAGLSYRWEMADTKEELRATCIITHVMGHSEQTSMSASPDDSGAKNDIQQRGSSFTYLQRYTLIAALGLTTANDDDDGKSSGALNVERLIAHNDLVRDCWMEIAEIKAGLLEGGDLHRAVEYYIDLGHEVQTGLWLAPSKGGLFTTEERRRIKEGDFAAMEREILRGRHDKEV
jgi:hypothetical protein